MDKVEPYTFHTLGLPSGDETLKGLFANFTRRMRDEVGAKFQCILYDYPQADFEGSFPWRTARGRIPETPGWTGNPAYGLVYWLAGAEAGCPVNKTLTNATYDGEYAPDTAYTQAQLEAALKAGKLLFHRVGDETRVLKDRNTFLSYTGRRGRTFPATRPSGCWTRSATTSPPCLTTGIWGKSPTTTGGESPSGTRL